MPSVAGLQPERNQWLDELEKEEDWELVIRTPSPRNPFQKKTRVEIKRRFPRGGLALTRYLGIRSDLFGRHREYHTGSKE